MALDLGRVLWRGSLYQLCHARPSVRIYHLSLTHLGCDAKIQTALPCAQFVCLVIRYVIRCLCRVLARSQFVNIA